MARPPEGPLIETAELTPARWEDLAALFGKNGACAGCWCMFWRLEKGERFEDVKGAPARRRFRRLVADGRVHGLLAYAAGEPVGWLTFGPRPSFPALDSAPSLACDDAAEVWALPCFFVRRDWRGRGVATALLRAALRVLAARGARIAEGYPTKPSRPGAPIPAAFAYTGTVPLFTRQGFEVVAARPRGRQRVRRRLRPPSPSTSARAS